MSTMVMYSAAIASPFFVHFWPIVVRRNEVKHSASSKIFLWILYVALAYFQFAQNVLSTLNLVSVGLFSVDAGSALLFPSNLAILLYLYVHRSANEFRRVCVFLVLVNAAIALGSVACQHGWIGLIPEPWLVLCTSNARWLIVTGTVLLIVDAILMISLYGWIASYLQPPIGRFTIPLLATMCFDAFFFSICVSIWREGAHFGQEFLAEIVSKSLIGVFYGLWLIGFLRYWDRTLMRVIPAKPLKFLLDGIKSWKMYQSLAGVVLTTADFFGVWTAKKKKLRAGGQQQNDLTNPFKNGIQPKMEEIALEWNPEAYERSQARKRLEADREGLLKSHSSDWVAYDSNGIVDFAPTFEELMAKLAGDATGLCIEPIVSGLVRDVELGPEHATQNVPCDVEWLYEARENLCRDWDQLLIDSLNQWVAYDAKGLIAKKATYSELQVQLEQMNRTEVLIRQIIPWLSLSTPSRNR